MKNLLLIFASILFVTSCDDGHDGSIPPLPFDISGTYELLDKSQIPEGFSDEFEMTEYIRGTTDHGVVLDYIALVHGEDYTRAELDAYSNDCIIWESFQMLFEDGVNKSQKSEIKFYRDGTVDVNLNYIVNWRIDMDFGFHYEGTAKKIK